MDSEEEEIFFSQNCLDYLWVCEQNERMKECEPSRKEENAELMDQSITTISSEENDGGEQAENAHEKLYSKAEPLKKIGEILQKLQKTDQYYLCIPNIYGLDGTNHRNDSELSSVQRRFILKWVATAIKTFQLTSKEDLKEISTLLVETYPDIQSGDGIAGVISCLTKYIGLDNSNATKSTLSIPIDEKDTYRSLFDVVIEKINAEMNSPNISTEALKVLLNSIRVERIASAKSESPEKHLKNFPCFKMKELLFWEYCQQADISANRNDLKTFWIQHIPRMKTYFSSESHPISAELSEVPATIKILQNMIQPTFFGCEPSNDRLSNIIEIFPVGTPKDETLPNATDPPRLIAIGDPTDEHFEASIYIGDELLCTGELFDSLIDLTAAYHVFQISPATSVNMAFSFLFRFFLRQRQKSMCLAA